MPIEHKFYKNYSTDNNETLLPDMIFNGGVLVKEFDREECFAYNTIKISTFSLVGGTLTIEFTPNYIPTEIAGGTVETGFSRQSTTLITFPSHTITIPANVYKYYQIPVEGEYFKITITHTTASNFYLRTALSNNSSFVNLDT